MRPRRQEKLPRYITYQSNMPLIKVYTTAAENSSKFFGLDTGQLQSTRIQPLQYFKLVISTSFICLCPWTNSSFTTCQIAQQIFLFPGIAICRDTPQVFLCCCWRIWYLKHNKFTRLNNEDENKLQITDFLKLVFTKKNINYVIMKRLLHLI